MGRKIPANRGDRGSGESGGWQHSWNEGRYRVALVYPNTYRQGMSNLGFHSVYDLINQRDDCLCERFFLPDASPSGKGSEKLLSIESRRPLSDFHVLALSISFENDYLNLPEIFRLAQLPWFAEERDENSPLVLLGGVCAFLNPEPVAAVVDVIAVGEAEALLNPLLDTLQQSFSNRDEKLKVLARLPGIYVPRFYVPVYGDNGVTYETLADVPQQVLRQYLKNLDEFPTRNVIRTDDTEFGHMALIEVSRGCTRGCRFCAAGFIYLPFRERSLDQLLPQIEAGLCHRDRIGLVAAAVADYSHFDQLQQGILQRGGSISVSSLRLDAITETSISNLYQAGHATISIAPEAGSQRMRNLINKGFGEDEIITAVEMAASGGIRHLKLYFLVGLPGEKQEDIDAIVDLARRIANIWRDAGRLRGETGRITLSVNPFVPKPFTPLQWAPMAPEKYLKEVRRFLQRETAKLPNVQFMMESPRLAILQGLLARGDRRLGALLPVIAGGGNLKQLCKAAAYPLEEVVFRPRGQRENFPWEIIDQGVRRQYLWQEYQKGLSMELTQACFAGCRRCGLCG